MNKKYILAVSGGPDSMALLNKYKKKNVLICHVNYHKRNESNNDQRIVEQFCKHNNLPIKILNVNEEMYSNIDSSNFQNLARIIRYDFFNDIGKQFSIKKILIGHNLDDFIETALMQQNRNSKNFFYGIKKKSIYKELRIIRPLINKTKKQLEQYCLKKKIDFAIDETNNSDLYERNKIRKELFNKSTFYKKKLKLIFTIKNKLLKSKQNKTVKLYKKWKDTNFDVDFFNQYEAMYKTFIIYYYLKYNNIDKISLTKIDLIIDFLEKSIPNKKLRLKDDLFILRNKDNIELVRMFEGKDEK